jgi:hypothetical protein
VPQTPTPFISLSLIPSLTIFSAHDSALAPRQDSAGLVPGHAYAVLAARELPPPEPEPEPAAPDGPPGQRAATAPEAEAAGAGAEAGAGAGRRAGARVVRLRNPWGHGGWRGDWGRASSLWTPAARAALAMDDGADDDGVFARGKKNRNGVRKFSQLPLCFLSLSLSLLNLAHPTHSLATSHQARFG